MSLLTTRPRRRIPHPADVRAAWLVGGMVIGATLVTLIFWVLR
jgi:hypothetical protein